MIGNSLVIRQKIMLQVQYIDVTKLENNLYLIIGKIPLTLHSVTACLIGSQNKNKIIINY